ncbi:MAG TPA: hypothetical protein VFG83_18420 [Kofleriaceae bacterium]|nr:hypothetical protein [Kofleriaceae bacterium]
MTAAAARFAVVELGTCTVALAAEHIAAILDPEDVDESAGTIIDLNQLFGIADDDGPARLLCLAGAVSILIRGRIAFLHLDVDPCHRPPLIAGALRRRCLRGIAIAGERLIYLLDPGALDASSLGPPTDPRTGSRTDGESCCASD